MSSPVEAPAGVFAGAGDTRRRARELDWSATALGPVGSWSPALRVLVRMTMDSPFPICLWCGEGRVLIYNDAYSRVLGAKHPSALGRPGWTVWTEVWQQIGPWLERIEAGGRPIYREDAPFVTERAVTEPAASAGAGREPNAWFTFSLSAVREEGGGIVAILNVVYETTSRILAERSREAALAAAERAGAQLRDIFEQAPAFMAVLRGADLVFEYVNDAYYQLVGHRELLEQPMLEALPELRGQGFDRLLHNVMETQTAYVGREVSLQVARMTDGPAETRFLDFVYYPVTNPEGTRGVVAHGYDITDHVLAREDAKRARADAELANRAKSQFLANMSHEIRTPINAVVGYTDLLDARIAGPLTDRQQEFVERIRASSRHLLALVNDVLDLSKIEAGEMLVSRAPHRVSDVLGASVEMVLPEAAARGLTLREDSACPDTARYIGDQDRVRQILLNLLSNALKFTHSGGSVVARCRLVERPAPHAALPSTGPWIVLEVEDTGVGIAADELERIFQAFVQAETGHTRRAGGTGLGLTISQRLARLMGGDLTVRSEPGRGSCFSLWLPASAQERVTRAETPAEPGPSRDLSPFAALGQAMLESIERLEEELVWRLRAEHGAVPGTAEGNSVDEAAIRARFADYTAALLAGIARAVVSLEDQDANRELLDDGRALRAEVARRHGIQRRRLGWQRADVDREYSILRQTVESFAQAEGPRRTDRDIAPALEAVHRFIDQARQDSLTAFQPG